MRRSPEFVVWYGESKEDAKYLVGNTRLADLRTHICKMFGNSRDFPKNPNFVQQMLYLDKPDLIVAAGDPLRPIFGVELSAEAPSGHDIFQRFGRIVAAAEQGTPFAYVFPERKWVRRRGTQGRWDEFNPLVVSALVQISRIHGVPALPFLWPANLDEGNPQQGYLVCRSQRKCQPPPDHEQIRPLWEFADLAIGCYLENRPFSDIVFTPFFQARERTQWTWYSSRGGESREWSPLTSCEEIKTASLINEVSARSGVRIRDLPDILASRPRTIIYSNDSKTFRADPYAGALVAVDYLKCRNGPTTQHRHANLAIHFQNVSIDQVVEKAKGYHTRNCPLKSGPRRRSGDSYYTLHLRDGCRYTKQKELRTICYFADLVVFKDGVLL